MAISLSKSAPRASSMTWRILSIDVGMAILGLAITTGGLCVEIWPLEASKSAVNNTEFEIQELATQEEKVDAIDKSYASLMQGAMLTNALLESSALNIAKCDCEDLIRYYRKNIATNITSSAKVMNGITSGLGGTSDSEEVVDAKIEKASEEYQANGGIVSFIKLDTQSLEIRNKFIKSTTFYIQSSTILRKRLEILRSTEDMWSLIAGATRIGGFVLVLLASMIGTKLLELKLEAKHKP